MGFFSKQFIDVIEWMDQDGDVLSFAYPMEDHEIQTGAKLTVRDSQLALFVNEGQIADVLEPGLHTLNTHTLPLLTNLKNWDKLFKSPFKSDLYFFSTRLQTGQKWGTATPITFRDKEFGAVRIRAYGIYSYRISDPKTFYQKVSGTSPVYRVADLEAQLRDSIIGRMADVFASSNQGFLDMAANQVEFGREMMTALQPSFQAIGLILDSFVVENISLPEELQAALDKRITMNMIGDMGRYTQYQVAEAVPLVAEGGGPGGNMADVGVGLGMGMAVAQQVSTALNTSLAGFQRAQVSPPPPPPPPPASAAGAPIAPSAGETKFCINCGHQLPRIARFCSDCGGAQQ